MYIKFPENNMEKTTMKKSYTAGFKSRVAIEAIKGEKTLAELASIYQVHVSQIRQWKSKAMEALPRVFESKKEKRQQEQEIGIDDVYKRVGQLEVENDFLKKKYRQFGIELK